MWPCIAMVKNNIFHVDNGKAHFDSLPDKFAWMDGRIRWFVVLGKETNVLLRAARERKLWRVMITHILKNMPHRRSRPLPSTKTLPCISFCILLNLDSDSIPLEHLLFTITISLVTKSCQCQIIGQLTLSNVELE